MCLVYIAELVRRGIIGTTSVEGSTLCIPSVHTRDLLVNMKIVPSVSTLVVLLLGLALVNAFPRERDVESVEKTDTSDEEEAEPGTGFVYIPSFYSFFPDFDLASRIRGLVTRLRDQIGDSFADVDWSKGNTTSTTKVVDGHVVTVNETSYKDDDSDLVLHIKVIDVKPSEGPETFDAESSEAAAASSSRPTENDDSEGNEIPKQEDDVAELPYFDRDYPTPKEHHDIEAREYVAPDYSANDVDYPVNEVDNSVDVFAQPPYDLGRDIYINKLMSDKTMSQGMFEVPADVEVFSTDDRHIYETVPIRSEPIRHWNERFR